MLSVPKLNILCRNEELTIFLCLKIALSTVKGIICVQYLNISVITGYPIKRCNYGTERSDLCTPHVPYCRKQNSLFLDEKFLASVNEQSLKRRS